MPDSGDHHCFVTRPPVLEVTTRQTGKFYLPAVRSEKEECVVAHQDILWQLLERECKKKDALA